MYKIISISNAHEFDGVELTQRNFMDLCDVLQFSKYVHTIKYEINCKQFTRTIGSVGR